MLVLTKGSGGHSKGKGKSAGMANWAETWQVCYAHGDLAKYSFWTNWPNPWPDCSGKRARALKGLLPGVIPKQHNFVQAGPDASATIIINVNK